MKKLSKAIQQGIIEGQDEQKVVKPMIRISTKFIGAYGKSETVVSGFSDFK